MAPWNNLLAGWIAILLGCVAGAIQGLFFHNESWLGGYGSWRRRMLRLGHISFFGIGLINLAFAVTAAAADLGPAGVLSRLLILAVVAMPAVCYLSAVRREFRHAFFVPVLSVVAVAAMVVWRLVRL